MGNIIYKDNDIVVAIKPAGIVSTDEIFGFPSVLREELGSNDEMLKTVHRLDQVVSGIMVLARSLNVAQNLTDQIMNNKFLKYYLAVIHGCPKDNSGTYRDYLIRDKSERKTYVTNTLSKDSREAILNYTLLEKIKGFSLLKIELVTGRTHQIRAQLSSRNLPIVGDKKYSENNDDCNIALCSSYIEFIHPSTGKKVSFSYFPPNEYPYNMFEFFDKGKDNEL